MNKRFTASRVPDSGIEVLFATEERWQAWLDIESALALTQADLEMIPREAADAITAACRIERLDLGRIREGIARTSHPLMPLIVELSRVVGEEVLQLFNFAEKSPAFAILLKSSPLILRHLNKAVFGKTGNF